MEMYKTYFKSPVGILLITGNQAGIASIEYINEDIDINAQKQEVNQSLKTCCDQLEQYFLGKRKEFSFELQIHGTEFQEKVWNELRKIPYGKTVSYRDIATAVGDQKAVRAVGGANGRNKIAIVIPCHRVIGLSGKLTGYAGGLDRKEWLLKHEGILK